MIGEENALFMAPAICKTGSDWFLFSLPTGPYTHLTVPPILLVWEFGGGAARVPSKQEYLTRDIFGQGNGAAGYGMDIPLL